MSVKRNVRALGILDGPHRSFEWYWAPSGIMPGLNAFENLTARDQDDFLASVTHWAGIAVGTKALQTRVNSEHDNPIIVAIKAGKHRFTAFREEHGSMWIVAHAYLKEGQKRDKTGDRAIEKAIAARTDYFKRVAEGTYYERN